MKVLQTLIAFPLSVVPRCHAAVTWQTVGCNNYAYRGQSIDAIWDNAIALAQNAQRQIDAIPTKPSTSSKGRIAGANAKFMFGVEFSSKMGMTTGLDSKGKMTMATVRANYADIQGALSGTLSALDTKAAFLFCEGIGLETGNPKDAGFPSLQNDVWYAKVTIDNQDTYLLPPFSGAANAPQPCSENINGRDVYIGKTFTAGRYVGGVKQGEITAVIICPNQLDAWDNAHPNTYNAKPTLPIGVQPTTPHTSEVFSIAGTLIHEMAHVIAHTRGPGWQDLATGFNEAVSLANGDQERALKNPDNYRLFAEMSSSPLTKWEAPKP
ncbi:hypothetical protein GGR57DRAFT_512117 [Xylariaceae sp. FL1272]|nr:hypothetical protein GGR57DRAFT_512117 [Xylariaceae sp. FL1272]